MLQAQMPASDIPTLTVSDDEMEAMEVHRHCATLSPASSRSSTPATQKGDASDKWFVSLAERGQHEDFLTRAASLMLQEAVFKVADRNSSRVLEWQEPEQLRRLIEFDVNEAPVSQDRLLELMDDVIRYSVKTGHPRFVNQLFSSVDPYGLAGQWLCAALNPSVYTYEVAPVFTLMEETVLSEMRKIVGFTQGDGLFAPGGSMANGYGVSCARYAKFPKVKTEGLRNLPRLVVMASEDAHYSVQKMAALFGLGADNVYSVAVDERGRMNPSDLEAQVERAKSEGAAPFMVLATAGTTVMGAFDPIQSIADLCEKHDMWLHVDAAWGGGALMSNMHKHKLDGIHRADSVTWNPHKLLAAPQQCSVFLTRHCGVLSECHSAAATYLFQQDKFYDTSLDTGDKHVQCGRRADVLKFWLMWKAKGTSGLVAHIDTVFDAADYATKTLKSRADFKLVLDEPECTNVCFWYIPPSLQGVDPMSHGYNEKLHKVAPKIKERMMREGSMMVTYQPLRHLPNFFRLVVQSSGVTHEDIDFFIHEIARLGADL
ncbi:Hypothetical predicted protein [Cloeon dipterum]|uniref:Glutamate decarboxylase n=1 Tax=Cloeon dipterum TaxID=197152 RepID=A0A8S1C7N4_9INSE|nr:Hypothetical predicted protein [Cloeon dipterum]